MKEETAEKIKKYSAIIGGIEELLFKTQDTTIYEGMQILQSVYIARLGSCLLLMNSLDPKKSGRTLPEYLRELAEAYEKLEKEQKK